MRERGFDLLWKLIIWKSCSSRCALLTYFGHSSNSRFDHVCLPTAVSGWADACSSFEHGRDWIMFPLQSLWPSCHQEQRSLSTCASSEHGCSDGGCERRKDHAPYMEAVEAELS